MKNLIFFYFLVVFGTESLNVEAKVTAVVGDKIYECEDIPRENLIETVDYSNFQIYHENDTHTYLNGSVKFQKEFDRLPGRIYTEFFVRGKWIIQLFDRQYMDLCFSFHNPSEPFYNQTKNFPNCPVKAGAEWTFDMVHLRASDDLLTKFPTSLSGLWRVTVSLDFMIDGHTKKNCKVVHCDIYEV